MKTYLIEDSSKTMKGYIRGTELYECFVKNSGAYCQNFKDRDSYVKNRTNQDVLNEMAQIAKDYGSANEYDTGSISGFKTDIENAINKANKDKNFEAVKEIKNLVKKAGFIRELRSVRDAIDNANRALYMYDYGLGIIIKYLKVYGVTK